MVVICGMACVSEWEERKGKRRGQEVGIMAGLKEEIGVCVCGGGLSCCEGKKIEYPYNAPDGHSCRPGCLGVF